MNAMLTQSNLPTHTELKNLLDIENTCSDSSILLGLENKGSSSSLIGPSEPYSPIMSDSHLMMLMCAMHSSSPCLEDPLIHNPVDSADQGEEEEHILKSVDTTMPERTCWVHIPSVTIMQTKLS